MTTTMKSPLQLQCMRTGGTDGQMHYFRPSAKMGHRSYLDVLPSMTELLRNAERCPTRATIPEVCIKYIRGLCQWGSKCSRIHPIDKTPFHEILYKCPRNGVHVNLAQRQIYKPVQSGHNAHSFEPSLSLTESPQTIFDSFSDQELRDGDAPSKHDTSTGSWDAETGCWVMECNAEIWESDFRFQGVFENRKKIEEGCFFEEEAKEDSDLSFIEKWLLNVQECCDINPGIRNVEVGKPRAGKRKRPGPPCDTNRCGRWTKGNCDLGEKCRSLPANIRHET